MAQLKDGVGQATGFGRRELKSLSYKFFVMHVGILENGPDSTERTESHLVFKGKKTRNVINIIILLSYCLCGKSALGIII